MSNLILSSLAEVSFSDLRTHMVQNIMSVQGTLVLEHTPTALLGAFIEAHLGRVAVIELDVDHQVTLLFVRLPAAIVGATELLLLSHGDILIVIVDRHVQRLGWMRLIFKNFEYLFLCVDSDQFKTGEHILLNGGLMIKCTVLSYVAAHLD